MAREPFNRVWAENPDGTGPNTFQEPSNTRLEKGWVGGASGEPPLAGEENWWHNRVDAAMQQIERFGVMDWHAEAIYGIGGRARGSDGKFYRSLTTPNEANDPTTDGGANWIEDSNFGGSTQSWQDVTSSRSLGVTYTNSTGLPIYLEASLIVSPSSSAELVINSVGVARFTRSAATTGVDTYALPFIIPDGATYRISLTGTVSLQGWHELR
jgi:hypothetical protein